VSKQSIINDLEAIKEQLERCEADAQELTGYSHQAIDLAWQTVCHAIDLVRQAYERSDSPSRKERGKHDERDK
jgi:hypothetical protein